MTENAGCGCQFDASGKVFADHCVCDDVLNELGKDGQVMVMRGGKRVWEWPDEASQLRYELNRANATIDRLIRALRAAGADDLVVAAVLAD